MNNLDRSNQRSAPEFILVTTDLGGEWRFSTAVASRLQSLGDHFLLSSLLLFLLPHSGLDLYAGALTQGDRRAVGGASIQHFAMEEKYVAHLYVSTMMV